MPRKRVVITGIGVLTPIGIGKSNFWRSLRKGDNGFRNISFFDTSNYKVKVAGEIQNFDPISILGRKGLLDLDRATKLLLCSSQLCLEDSRLDILDRDSSSIGVSVGTTLGSLSSISRFNRESYIEGPRFANPSVFPNTVVNSPASRVGIRFNITGFNSTISTGMCSAIDALDFAWDFIDAGRITTSLVGSVEDFSLQAFLGCYKLGVLSALADGSSICCPFDKRRNGIILSEGSATFVLEELSSALDRDAHIYAEVLGTGSSFDYGKPYRYSWHANGMKRAVLRALESSGKDASQIDCVFASANSTTDADRSEAVTLKKIFGDSTMITAIKGYVGETFSASGGLSLAAALGSLSDNFLPALSGFQEAEKDWGLNFLTKPYEGSISTAMINSFSPSGANSVLIIGKYYE